MPPLLHNLVLFFAYGFGGALMMAVSLAITFKIWDFTTPIDEWEELKNGNLAVAIVTAAVILGVAIVIAAAIAPGS